MISRGSYAKNGKNMCKNACLASLRRPKFQKEFCFKMRAVGLINIKTEGGCHLRKWSVTTRPTKKSINLSNIPKRGRESQFFSRLLWNQSCFFSSGHVSFVRFCPVFLLHQISVCSLFQHTENVLRCKYGSHFIHVFCRRMSY